MVEMDLIWLMMISGYVCRKMTADGSESLEFAEKER